MTDLLTVQDEISRHIGATLSKRFGAQPGARPASLNTRNLDAYDAYLRGLWHLRGRSSAGHDAEAPSKPLSLAVQDLERAVARDPNFALARAALASAYTQHLFYESTDREFERLAFKQIELALAIEPELAEAYLARAQLTWTAVNSFPHAAAIRDLRRAISINPNLAQAFLELAKVYYHVGLTDRAVEASARARHLDPLQAASSDRAFRAMVDAGRLADVQGELTRNRNLGPHARAEALIAIGRFDEALQLLSALKDTVHPGIEYDAALQALTAVVYARLGRREDAERVIKIDAATADNPTALSHLHHAQFSIGATLAWIGRHDEAVTWLTKAASEGYPSYPKFSTDQSLAPLKRHAGFGALLARLRNEWVRWQETL